MSLEELRSGAMDEDYEASMGYGLGISSTQAARIADRIEAETRVTGGAPSSTPLERRPGNAHLSGYGHPDSPYREVD